VSVTESMTDGDLTELLSVVSLHLPFIAQIEKSVSAFNLNLNNK